MGLVIILLMILVLGLTAGIAAISGTFLMNERNVAFTQTKLKALASAISSTNVVAPAMNLRHYEQDVGALPGSLADLVTKPAAVAACAMNSTTQALAGWCGPYWTDDFSGMSTFADGWGNTLVFSASPRRLYSYGPNQADNSGASDDIVQTY